MNCYSVVLLKLETFEKLSVSAYQLLILSKKVNVNTLLLAYHGLVVSVLMFGIIFWGNCTEREAILKAQKRCLRSMFKLKVTDSCVPIFKSYKLLPCLYILEVAIFVKQNNKLFPALRETRKRSTGLRSKYQNMLSTVSCNTALLKKGIMGVAPVIYNKIPDSMKNQPVRVFRQRLASFLKDKCYYCLNDFLNDNIVN